MGIAGSFAQLVGNDALVDTSMLRSHSREHQAMDIPVWGGRDSDTGLELGGYFEGWTHATPGLPLHPHPPQGGGEGEGRSIQQEVCSMCSKL